MALGSSLSPNSDILKVAHPSANVVSLTNICILLYSKIKETSHGVYVIDKLKIQWGDAGSGNTVNFSTEFEEKPVVIITPSVSQSSLDIGYSYYSAVVDLTNKSFVGYVWFLHGNDPVNTHKDPYSWVAIGY